MHRLPREDPAAETGLGVDVPGWVTPVSIAGIVGVSWYVASWAVAGWLTPGYDAARQAISELFAIGAPTVPSVLVGSSLVGSGLALIGFGAALHRGLPGTGLAGPALATISGVMTVLVVAFPCSPGCPGAGASPTDTMHTLVAATGYLALILAPLAMAIRVRHHDPGLAAWSMLLGGVALAGFVLRALGVAEGLAGLQQRTFNTVADAWYVMVAVVLIRQARRG